MIDPSKMTDECYLCHSSSKELRPYGANKQLICLGCLKSSPETKAEASRQFAELLGGHDGVSVIDGTGAPRRAEESERKMLEYYGLTTGEK